MSGPLHKDDRPTQEKMLRKHAGALLTVGFLVSLLTHALMGCMCGLLPVEAMFGTLPGAVISWLGFTSLQEPRLAQRIGAIVATVFSTWALLQNVHNVLWSGHNPFFDH